MRKPTVRPGLLSVQLARVDWNLRESLRLTLTATLLGMLPRP